MPSPALRSPLLARFTVATITINLAVILWGAWVRASGSGAGCGAHWPLCNNELIPQNAGAHTLTEFAHRLTSGMALVLVIGMVVLARRHFPKGHATRFWTWISLLFITLEALIGAGLVLFKYVADNDSIFRAIWLGGHLLNTLLMLGAFGMTWWAASGRPVPAIAAIRREHRTLFIALGALLLTGIAGAVASLGDTLFPSSTLREGMQQDFAPAAHLFLKLRVWHPVIAVATGVFWLALTRIQAFGGVSNDAVQRAARRVVAMVVLQWAIGLTTLVLLVPVPLQLLHLLTADLLWLTALYFTATSATTTRV